MRQTFSPQLRFDCSPIASVQLNANCRDEIVLILKALQYIYSQSELRHAILNLIKEDINHDSRPDIGREGFSYWEILVLAAVRLGCNLDYDKLQDLAEQHRALRHIMGIGDWNDKRSFNWRRIRDTLCLLKPETIDRISQLIVGEGHSLDPAAAKKVRADSFVVETNIHHPTESSLIYDGLRKVIPLCVAISGILGVPGWRQHEHLLRSVKKIASTISRFSGRKGSKNKRRTAKEYQRLLKKARKILARARQLSDRADASAADVAGWGKTLELQHYVELTERVCSTAYRRVILGETVPNADKIFSIFEPHTQLYRRGKASQPNQFGRLVLIFEDGTGFISHSHVLPRDAQDQDVAVTQTRIVQQRHGERIDQLSFDRGFYSPENEKELARLIEQPCLPKHGPREYADQMKTATVHFREARQRHPGVESAVGALQSGNALDRCRDRTEIGFRRYIALAILGRNLHVLGKMLIQKSAALSHAAYSERDSAA